MNAGWNTLFTVGGIGMSFVTAPILIHNLGTAQYGILLIVWSVTGMLGVLGFGLGEATLRYIAYYYADHDMNAVNRVLGATLSFYLGVCLLISLALVFATPLVISLLSVPAGEKDTIVALMRLAAILFALRILSRTYNTIPMALNRYDISSKIGLAQNVVRSVGYVVLAILQFQIIDLLIWELLALVGAIGVQYVVVRRIAPSLNLLPTFSFVGFREIFSFSVFSFLSYAFLTVYREASKLVLAAQLGPVPVAYLSTPDNVARRVSSVVASGSATLMPRFSASRDARVDQKLLSNGTWASLAISLIMLVPLIILMPDLLTLWIGVEFSAESALVGQLMTVGYVSQGAYAPSAAFFRGAGRPGVVTIVLFFAAITTLLLSLLLIPIYGAVGVGYAYAIGSLSPLFGVVHALLSRSGVASLPSLLRAVGLPLLIGCASGLVCLAIRGSSEGIGWLGLLSLCGLFVAIIGMSIVAADVIIGGEEAPSRRLLRRGYESEWLRSISDRVAVRGA